MARFKASDVRACFVTFAVRSWDDLEEVGAHRTDDWSHHIDIEHQRYWFVGTKDRVRYNDVGIHYESEGVGSWGEGGRC